MTAFVLDVFAKPMPSISLAEPAFQKFAAGQMKTITQLERRPHHLISKPQPNPAILPSSTQTDGALVGLGGGGQRFRRLRQVRGAPAQHLELGELGIDVEDGGHVSLRLLFRALCTLLYPERVCIRIGR